MISKIAGGINILTDQSLLDENNIDIEEAVSYRIPQFVTKVAYFKEGTTYPYCPRCNITLEREYQCFCDRCGQALNWDLLDYATIIYK